MNENSYDSLQDVVHEKGESRTIKWGKEWILVFNTLSNDTDIMSNIRDLVSDLDIEDMKYIDSLLIIGGKKSVKVDSNLVEDLVGVKTKSQVIIDGIKEELDRDFGYKLYDRGPHKRLFIRLPIIEMKYFYETLTNKIKNIILTNDNFPPGNISDILSVYLIADENHVRLEPELFFQEIFGFKKPIEKKEFIPQPSGKIIQGESHRELVELALKKLEEYDIYRDIQLVDAAGLEYSFDALATSEDERIFLKYLDNITDDDMISMKLFIDAFQAKQGWILTKEQNENKNVLEIDNISIITIKNL
ncbi:MAG: hypothetical protein IBX40_10265 [Methanosarcinales archaeon]|nr:hypothetical protein [Methanosarcinales archaeon]